MSIGSFNIVTQEGETHAFLVGKDYVYHIDFSFYLHSEELGTEILCGKYPDWIEAMDDSDVPKAINEINWGEAMNVDISSVVFDEKNIHINVNSRRFI